MTVFFISDCHLCPSRPTALNGLLTFLRVRCPQEASALYILGDFFEVWIGDDVILPWQQPVIDALSQLADCGVNVYFMQGNRDFLVGKPFCQRTQMQLLGDTHLITQAPYRLVLMHGDLLCSDDVQYQRFRRIIRNRFIKTVFLSLPKRYRQRLADKARAKSKAHTQKTLAPIMDVNADTLERYVVRFAPTHLIHGHTHRPIDETRTTSTGHCYQRLVMGDWHAEAVIVAWHTTRAPTLETLHFSHQE